jgi:hypothetical protein
VGQLIGVGKSVGRMGQLIGVLKMGNTIDGCEGVIGIVVCSTALG